MNREEIRRKNILIIKLRLLLKMGQKEAIEKAANELEDLINEERIKNRKQWQIARLRACFFVLIWLCAIGCVVDNSQIRIVFMSKICIISENKCILHRENNNQLLNMYSDEKKITSLFAGIHAFVGQRLWCVHWWHIL